jgi:predicted dehydrogenase
MKTLRIGVVGVGSLGQHHARILAGLPGVELAGVVDADPQRAREIAAKHGCPAFPDIAGLKSRIDAATVATPTKFHGESALPLLAAGIPCLVEKPLAANVPEARLIVQAAKQAGTILQVGHIERFNPGFTLVATSKLSPKYIEARRLAPFSGRGLDVGVVFDLMIHDLDLVLSLMRSKVVTIDAVGVSVLGRHEDMASVRLHFLGGGVCSLTASRVHPQAVRTMHLFGPEGYAGIDFAAKSATMMQPGAGLRTGRVNVRALDAAGLGKFKDELFGEHLQTMKVTPRTAGDQLTAELEAFAEAVRHGRPAKVSGEDGLAAVELAQEIVSTMARHDWQGDGAYFGPEQLPPAQGFLFEPAAAAPATMPRAA